ncbi:PREDICTED: arylamine N-acetyltransferase 2-like [Dipodomys ordii]|uniref:arylamine N-acetyltransferase n=1 Tax=Dipodomys ordii TaxID=10020 RepID=A0A1S3FVB1_DIPOR|nr:PREDICTED: arylamine N-acetyltransferase 2-like [Dipodomys ordii]
MDIESYFERIGYKNSGKKLDLETLTEILQHQIRAIPYENLHMHCGESMDMALEAIFDQIVNRKRGGWCFQLNQLLCWVLTTMGFETTMLGGYVYIPPAKKYGSDMTHLLLRVSINGKDYIVDAGFGSSYQIWEPLELISGKDQPQVPSVFQLTEEKGIWYLDQIRREQYVPDQEFMNSEILEKNKYRKVFSFTLEPRKIEDFKSASMYLQTSPTSLFVNTTYCTVQTADGTYCLMGFLLAHRKFSYKDNVDLVEFKTLKEEEIEEVLKTIFGISLEIKYVPKHGDKFFTI